MDIEPYKLTIYHEVGR